MNKKLIAIMLSAGALTLASMSYAQPVVNKLNKDYIGIGVNYNAIQKDTVNVNNTSFKLNKDYIGYNLFTGQRLSKHFAHELGLQMLGKTKWKTADNQNIENKKTYHAYYDAYMLMPVNSYLDIFANGGVSYISSQESGTNINEKIKTFGLNYGAGVQVNLNKLTVRGRYMRLAPAKEINGLDGITDSVNLEVAYYLA